MADPGVATGSLAKLRQDIVQSGGVSALLCNAVDMELSARQNAGHIQVTVTLTNSGAGHHVPTDYPGRHLILAVTAQDAGGRTLALQSGPTIPEWGGDHAGRPGKAYARVLRDVATGESPVVSYWKQALIESDNRLPALGSDTSVYTFEVAEISGVAEAVTVTAELRLRQAFQGVIEARGWDTPDMLMEESRATLSVQPWQELYLPLLVRKQ